MKKIVIEKNKLVENIFKIKGFTNSKIIATLKNNGYGLGLKEYPALLLENGIDFFAVSTPTEALTLRYNGFTNSILMLHSIALEDEILKLLKNNIILTVGSFSALSAINNVCNKNNLSANVHLKLDTGFGRFGFQITELQELTKSLKNLPNIKICGTFSHFTMSFNLKSNYTNKQFEIFKKCIEILKIEGINPGLLHICNSSAFLTNSEMHLDAVRIGSAFLGRILVPNNLRLNRIGILTSKIEDIKKLPKNHYIGYSNTYRTKASTLVAVVPVGYLDGFGLSKSQDCFGFKDTLREMFGKFKLFNKKTFVTINGEKIRVVGKIGTNNITIDLKNHSFLPGQQVFLDINPMLVNPLIPRLFY